MSWCVWDRRDFGCDWGTPVCVPHGNKSTFKAPKAACFCPPQFVRKGKWRIANFAIGRVLSNQAQGPSAKSAPGMDGSVVKDPSGGSDSGAHHNKEMRKTPEIGRFVS